jgi:hypothetical protein
MDREEFPKWKYHETQNAVIVQDPDEESALGEGWFDSPADIVRAKTKKAK